MKKRNDILNVRLVLLVLMLAFFSICKGQFKPLTATIEVADSDSPGFMVPANFTGISSVAKSSAVIVRMRLK
jgi:hypothetical protein